jgi:hypothetical protein
MISRGCRWRVGLGNLIHVWNDAWIKDDSCRVVETPVIEGLENMRVSDLMIPKERRWDWNLLEALFLPRDVLAISSIPLSASVLKGKRIWHFSKNGMYTAKSGYRVALETEKPELWNDLKLPLKIKFFLWRACTESIPTRLSLRQRGVEIEDNRCHSLRAK